MGKFKAGDRVKILAGHPYYAGRDDIGDEMTGTVVGADGKTRSYRAKYLVAVDGGVADTYAFKGRELEPLPTEVVADATTWVPKVGDRVNWTRVRGEFDGSVIESTDAFPFDFVLRATSGSDTLAYARELEPAPLTIEAGKFYRTRDGRKVGPVVEAQGAGEPWPTKTADGKLWFRANGHSCPGVAADHRDQDDLVAEWADEPAVAPATAAKAWAITDAKPGERVLCVSWSGKLFTSGKTYAVAGDGKIVDNEGVTRHSGGLLGEWRLATKFQPGDRVIAKDGSAWSFAEGKTYTVITNEDGFVTALNDNGVSDRWGEQHFELAPPAVSTEAPANDNKLTVGNKVVLTAPARITGFDKQNAMVVLETGGSFVLPIASLQSA